MSNNIKSKSSKASSTIVATLIFLTATLVIVASVVTWMTLTTANFLTDSGIAKLIDVKAFDNRLEITIQKTTKEPCLTITKAYLDCSDVIPEIYGNPLAFTDTSILFFRSHYQLGNYTLILDFKEKPSITMSFNIGEYSQ